jgi:hypothetical protein
LLGTSSTSAFYAMTLANGVKSLGIEVIDSLGASFRICSHDISVVAITDTTV